VDRFLRWAYDDAVRAAAAAEPVAR
jgi:hypothetical protein